MPDKSPRVPSIFREMRVCPSRQEKETVFRNPSQSPRLEPNRALEESSGRLHRILFPGVAHPLALSVALSRHTLFSLCRRPIHPGFPSIPATPLILRHTQPLFECLLACSSSVSITRRPPNKSIPPHPVCVNGTFGLRDIMV